MKKRINEQTAFHNYRQEYRFAIQTVTGIVMIDYEDVLLFEYVKSARKWQLRLINDKIHSLRSTINSADITSVSSLFIQINQYCVINIIHLLGIENKTQKCIFDIPSQGDMNKTVSPLYYKKIKDILNIL
jgi:two-component system LytT family response regulator